MGTTTEALLKDSEKAEQQMKSAIQTLESEYKKRKSKFASNVQEKFDTKDKGGINVALVKIEAADKALKDLDDKISKKEFWDNFKEQKSLPEAKKRSSLLNAAITEAKKTFNEIAVATDHDVKFKDDKPGSKRVKLR